MAQTIFRSGPKVGGIVREMYEIHWDHTDLTDVSTAGTYTFSQIPAGAWIDRARTVLKVAFSGGAVSAATVQVGDADLDALHTAVNCFTGATLGVEIGADGAEARTGATKPVQEAAYAGRITVTTTTADADALTAGSAVTFIYWERYLQDS